MGHEDQRRAVFVAQTKEHVDDRLTIDAIKVARGFIRKQDVGPGRRGARQRNPLLLTTGHLGGIVIGAVRQPNTVKLGAGTLKGICRPGKLKGSRDVFQSGHGRDQIEGLEHHAHVIAAKAGQRILVQRGQITPQHADAAAGRGFEPAHDHKERGFSRPGRSDQAERFAAVHVERNSVQDIDGSGIAFEAESHILKGNGEFGHGGVPGIMTGLVTYGVLSRLSKPIAFTLLLAGPVWAEPLEILALGDSLTQGYGLDDGDGFVPQLQSWLEARGHDVRIVNGGVSGDTTAGGLSRVAWSLTPEIDAMIVTLGGNDMLRGLPPESSKANLRGILEVAQEQSIEVLLIGMVAPGNFGPDFKATFDAMYADLAEDYQTLFVPDFFEGLRASGAEPGAMGDLMQADGIHPSAKGVPLIVDAIGPKVEELIEEVDPGS